MPIVAWSGWLQPGIVRDIRSGLDFQRWFFAGPRQCLRFHSDMYIEFSWGMLVAVFLIGRAYSYVWSRMRTGNLYWLLIYFAMLACSVYPSDPKRPSLASAASVCGCPNHNRLEVAWFTIAATRIAIMMTMRIWLLLTNIPSPYQVELLRRVAFHLSGRLDVRFFGLATRKDQSLPDIPFPNLTKAHLGVGKRPEDGYIPLLAGNQTWRMGCLRLERYLDESHPLGVSSKASSTSIATIAMARTSPSLTWKRRWQSDLVHPHAAQGVKAKVGPSTCESSQRHHRHGEQSMPGVSEWGIPENRLCSQPYAIDVDRFSPSTVGTIKWRTGTPTILFSGQLIPRKGIDTLCEVYRQVKVRLPSTRLLVLGEGVQRPLVESLAAEFPGDVDLAEKSNKISFLDTSIRPMYFYSRPDMTAGV